MARIAGSEAGKTKQLIVEKALLLIAQGGFEALTMRELSAAAGLQVGALYYHFEDKQALLAFLLNQHFDRLLDTAGDLDRLDPAGLRLENFAKFHIVFHSENRLSALLAAQEMRSLRRDNAAILLKKRGNYEKILRGILNEGAENGSFRIENSALMTSGMLGFLTEIAIWYRPGGKQSLDEVASDFAAKILRMVVA